MKNKTITSGIQVVDRTPYTMEYVKEHSPQFREMLDRMGQTPPDKPSELWQACKESGSTDEFRQLLGTTVGKKIISYFNQYVPKYPLIAGIDSVNKLGVSIPRVFVGEGADLVLKPEGANISRNKFTDNQYTISVNTYASSLAFTREAMINDDTGELMRSTARLGRMAARCIDKRLGAVIRANAAAYDGTAFFHSNHANTVTTALSADLVGANLIKTACQAIKKQQDIDSHDFLHKVPRVAFTSIDLYDTMAALCQTNVVASPTVGAPTHTVQNPAFAYGLRPIEFEWLGDTTDWYVGTDPNEPDPAFVVSFLNGDMTPKVLQRKTLYGGDFDFSNPACDIEFDVIMDFEVSMGDYRSMYAGIVAAGT